ncbi:MAG: hypothetical protein U5K76_08715 [Woeseiaceae bacterium]|nr:hypothetical protein [Woeseiaceae bacterium]
MRGWIIVLAACLAAPVLAERLPVEHFGHPPMIEQPTISPNGEWIAAVLNGEDGPTIVVSPFGSRELNAIVRLKYGQDRIDRVRWANDERLLIAVSEADSINGNAVRVGRLYQVGRDGEGMRQIRRKPTRPVQSWVSYLSTTHILSLLPEDPDHILMELYDERDEGFAVFKVDITRNDFEKQFINSYDVDDWYADRDGNVTFGLEFLRDVRRPSGTARAAKATGRNCTREKCSSTRPFSRSRSGATRLSSSATTNSAGKRSGATTSRTATTWNSCMRSTNSTSPERSCRRMSRRYSASTTTTTTASITTSMTTLPRRNDSSSKAFPA